MEKESFNGRGCCIITLIAIEKSSFDQTKFMVMLYSMEMGLSVAFFCNQKPCATMIYRKIAREFLSTTRLEVSKGRSSS